MMQIGRINADDRKIRFRIGADYARRVDPPIVQCNVQFARVLHDMIIRQNKTIAGNDESGTATRPSVFVGHANVNHAWRNSIGHGANRFGIRIEQLRIPVE
jgi:hypothetical protein